MQGGAIDAERSRRKERQRQHMTHREDQCSGRGSHRGQPEQSPSSKPARKIAKDQSGQDRPCRPDGRVEACLGVREDSGNLIFRRDRVTILAYGALASYAFCLYGLGPELGEDPNLRHRLE